MGLILALLFGFNLSRGNLQLRLAAVISSLVPPAARGKIFVA